MFPKKVLVTGANGYIGNAVARAFSRAGWITYGLVRSKAAAKALQLEEIIPVLGQIDDINSHQSILEQLPGTLDTIVSTTENLENYIQHHQNTIHLQRTIALSSKENAKGAQPLVIISSGCKDYGPGPHYAGDKDLSPHTEESPLNPPALLANRTKLSLEALKSNDDAFAAVVVRPTNVYGRSASYYGGFFNVASRAAQLKQPLYIPVPAASICHALHVDDCGDAYVALASHYGKRPEEIQGEVFNISARAYETVDEISKALVNEYSLPGVEYIEPGTEGQYTENTWPPVLIDFPQWTGSDKIRRVTGWEDVRPLFTESLHLYRLSYEAAVEEKHENVGKIKEREEAFRKGI
ncbi:hypothetical protein BDV18DRAFT_96557 [Aspergillus unguis]